VPFSRIASKNRARVRDTPATAATGEYDNRSGQSDVPRFAVAQALSGENAAVVYATAPASAIACAEQSVGHASDLDLRCRDGSLHAAGRDHRTASWSTRRLPGWHGLRRSGRAARRGDDRAGIVFGSFVAEHFLLAPTPPSSFRSVLPLPTVCRPSGGHELYRR